MRRTSTSGFTIAELLIVMVVLGVLIGLLYSPLTNLYFSNINGLKSVVQTTDVHSSLRLISRDLSLATGFAATAAVSSPLGYNNDGTTWDWRGTDSNHRVLIAGAYATNILPNGDTAGNRTLIFNSSDCSTPLTNTIIYFVKNSTLYRRTIKNTTSTCGGTAIAQQQTCAAGVSNAICKGADALILNNVSKFSVDYYASPASSTPISGEYNSGSTAPSTAQSILLTVTSTVGASSNARSMTDTLRVTPLNGGS